MDLVKDTDNDLLTRSLGLKNSVANMVPVLEAYHKVQRWISLGPRLMVQLLLLTIFLYFFGSPAFTRLYKQDVIVVRTTKDTNGIPFPAITLAVVGQITEDTCFHRNVSIEDCIVENTLNRSDILKGNAILGYTHRKEINLTRELLTEDFTSTWSGRYYTLNLPLKLGSHADEGQLFLGLNTNLTYTIFIHDPNFFFFNENPIALPTIMRRFQTRRRKPNGSAVYRLALTEVQKLNLPSSPCNEDAHFNFESCLRRSVSEKVFFEF